ncbi:hypothetical protein ACTFIU_004775 [Dictyostelium citrinum]
MRQNKQNHQQKQQNQQQNQQQKQQQQQQQKQQQQQQKQQQKQQQLLQQQQQQQLQQLQNQNLDKDVVLTYNIDSWKAYTYIYDVAIDNLINLHVPTIGDFQKELSCDVATNEVIRSAFYCAFHTKQRIINYNNYNNNNKGGDNLQQQQPPIVVEDIYINQSWFDYFSSRIQYKSSNRCLFKVKRFKKNSIDDLFNTKNTTSIGSKIKETNNSFKKIKTNELEEENFYFKPQQQASSKTLLDNSEEILKVDDENDDSILRYRYEKDFILLKDGKPLIISLSPDWGIPFHTKEVIETSPTPIPLPQVFGGVTNTNTNTNNNKNNKNKGNNTNNNNNNNNNSSRSSKNINNNNKKDEDGDSWCGIM